jgi:hypothetical protein
MNIYDYVAWNNRGGANQIVNYYGLRPANDPQGLAKQLALCVYKHKQEALDRVIDVHPDFYLIEEKVKESQPSSPAHSGACGCSSCNGYSNADGQAMKSDISAKVGDKTELLITGGIILIGLAMVLKLTTK